MPEWLMEIPREFWGVLSEMSPYLLFGFLAAGALSVLISPRLIEQHLGGPGFWPVLKASAFGVPLPLCSCGVIPVSASLRRHGASKGATTAFLISTPQTGVDSIFVTFSLLGPVYAVFRPVIALVSGVIGGGMVDLIDPDRLGRSTASATCNEECCTTRKGHWLRRVLQYGFVVLPRDIGKSLLAGLIIAALISAVITPHGHFSQKLEALMGGGIVGMLIMMALGIPVYVCATASVPVAAVLIDRGVSPGTALVFLMTGPATNAAALATIWQIMGRRTVISYLLTVAVMALASGLLLDYIFKAGYTEPPAPPTMSMMSPWVRNTAAVALLGVLGFALSAPKRLAHDDLSEPKAVFDAPGQPHAEQGRKVAIQITGMHCIHCVNSIRLALMETAGVQSAEVDLASGLARIGGHDIDVDTCVSVIEQLGYAASPVDTGAN